MGGTINVFLIYTKADSAILLRLLRHLDPLKKVLKIHFWYDDPIYADKEWSPQIVSRFEEADVYLLVISNTFMHSKFIKQVEFKMIIDRYKAGNSKVIPVILENCPWDINFEADEYTFNFKELHVLPEVGKPIKSWDSTEQALSKSAAYIKSIITSGTANHLREEPEMLEEAVAASEAKEDQMAIPISEEAEAKRRAEENKHAEEVAVQKKEAEEKRLMEEAQAEKRAAEKRRLKEVDEAKRKADKDNRLRAEAKAKRSAQEENRLRDRIAAKAETVGVEQTAPLEEDKEIRSGDTADRRKKVLLGVAVAALMVVLLVLFSQNNTQASEESPEQSKIETVVVDDASKKEEPIANEKQKVTPQGAAASMSKPGIGDKYNDGIIFEIDDNGKTGILAHMEDVGPMIWNDAILIHEQLGVGWRLPTLEELKKMYKTIGQGATNSGEFADELYWSATPYDVNQARLVRFSDGNTSYHYNSRGTHRKFLVRAVRDFSQ